MDRVDVGDLGGADDARDVQVALIAVGRADTDRFARQMDVGSVAVGFGVDSDGLDAHLVAGADHAKRDFASIGDENS